jgi:hypothetical protein
VYGINKYYRTWKMDPPADPESAGGGAPPIISKEIVNREKKNSKKPAVKKRAPARKPKAPAYVPPTGSELKLKHPWLNASAWDEWVEHRATLKKPIASDLMVTRSLNVLQDLTAEHQQAIIDKSIVGG